MIQSNDATHRHEDEQTRALHEQAAAPAANGQDPLWAARVLTVGGIAGLVYAVRLALSEFRARRVRRERGVPDPSPRQLN